MLQRLEMYFVIFFCWCLQIQLLRILLRYRLRHRIEIDESDLWLAKILRVRKD